ncbi:MAG: hypothetical protein J0L81_08885 [Caulobacterales bacterium]|nr:hypothetical protein [Caulobacterales bacterium]
MSAQHAPAQPASAQTAAPALTQVNVVSNVEAGGDVTISQIYAPGGTGIEPERYVHDSGAAAFSAEWLLYHQENVPFFGRDDELKRLDDFVNSGDGAGFRWWCIVGHGGVGKSRLALELLRRLTEGWAGGFVPKDKVAPSHAASWVPDRHTLWVVDYASAYGANLQRFLAVLARRFADSPFSVRVLVIERDYNNQRGWWSDLTNSLAREQNLLNERLHGEPMIVDALGARAPQFLSFVLKALAHDPERFFATVNPSADDLDGEIVKRTANGNTLMSLMLIAEVMNADARGGKVDLATLDLVQAFLSRELENVKRQSEKLNLDYRRLIYVWFMATCAAPLPYTSMDDVVVITHNRRAMARRRSDGLLEFPTRRDLEAIGIDVAGEGNAATLRWVSQGAGIDDPERYLSALAESGAPERRRWALQPDILGEVLVRLVINTLKPTPALERMRPTFERNNVASLVLHTRFVEPARSSAFFARLNDADILALVALMAHAAPSIRLVLAVLREINISRSERVQFQWTEFFQDSVIPASMAAPMRDYFTSVTAALDAGRMDGNEEQKLLTDERAWALPYLENLLTLPMGHRLALAALMCRKRDGAFYARMSNLLNVHLAIATVLRDFSTLTPDQSAPHAVAPILGEILDFLLSTAVPALAGARDATSDDHRAFARVVTHCGFLGLNADRFRFDASALYPAILDANAEAAASAQAAKDEGLLDTLQRQRVGLQALLSGASGEAWTAFETNLERYLSRPELDDGFELIANDYLWLATQTGDLDRFARFAEIHMPRAVQLGFDPAPFANAITIFVNRALFNKADLNDSEASFANAVVAIHKLYGEAPPSEAFEDVAYMFELFVATFANARRFEAVDRLLQRLKALLDGRLCSGPFIVHVLHEFARARGICQSLGGSVGEIFETSSRNFNAAEMAIARRGLSEAQNAFLKGVTRSTIKYVDGAGDHYQLIQHGIELETRSEEGHTQESGTLTLEAAQQESFAVISDLVTANIAAIP